MWTVNQLSKISGVTVRALHHYDAVGLLKPTQLSESGYRLYDESCLERLGHILMFRELDFSLREIARILDGPSFDRDQVLERQIELFKRKKERLEGLISFAEEIRRTGVYKMDFRFFDKEKIERYEAEAEEKWGGTEAYREYKEKAASYSDEKQEALGHGLMQIFAGFGKLKEGPADAPEAQAEVKALTDYISAHYYTCTKQILAGLGQMYAAGGEMSENIDSVGGPGTAAFAAKAIELYVS